MSYFFSQPRSHDRISATTVPTFMVCEQSTDVFELGLAIIDLYNNKECLSRSDIYSLFEGSEQSKTLLDGYVHEI